MSKENKKPMDANVKATIIRCISAVLCVAIVICGSSVISNKANKNKLEIAQSVNGGNSAADNGSTDSADPASDGTIVDSAAADSGVTGDETQKDTAAADTAADTAAPADSGTSDSAEPAQSSSSSSSSSSSAAKPSSSSSTASKAKTTAEIISIYNAATKKAVDAKVPFQKSRTTTEKKFDAGAVLKGMKKIVYQFMGVGSDNQFSENVTKEEAKENYFKYLQASRLTAADVTSATIKESNGTSTITLNLKNGASTVANGKLTSAVNNTALDKCGIAQGKEDKSYWDHKNAENIYAAIDEVPGCTSANISESYSGATVTLVVNANGQMTSMVVKFNFKAEMSKVMGSSGTAEASSVVTMNNFKW